MWMQWMDVFWMQNNGIKTNWEEKHITKNHKLEKTWKDSIILNLVALKKLGEDLSKNERKKFLNFVKKVSSILDLKWDYEWRDIIKSDLDKEKIDQISSLYAWKYTLLFMKSVTLRDWNLLAEKTNTRLYNLFNNDIFLLDDMWMMYYPEDDSDEYPLDYWVKNDNGNKAMDWFTDSWFGNDSGSIWYR